MAGKQKAASGSEAAVKLPGKIAGD